MVLRDDLLGGRRVVVAAGADSAVVPARLAALGAEVLPLAGELTDEEALAATTAALGHVDALLVDAGALFGTGGLDGLRAALDLTWNAVRAVARTAWIAERDEGSGEEGSPAEGGGNGRERGGTVVLVAPSPAAGRHAEAARAGLENMARTLSIEWARFGIRPMALAPGDEVHDAELADLVAFLVSPAGAYFSGQALAPA